MRTGIDRSVPQEVAPSEGLAAHELKARNAYRLRQMGLPIGHNLPTEASIAHDASLREWAQENPDYALPL